MTLARTLFAAVLMTAASGICVPSSATADVIDRIVAVVNDEVITQTDVLRALPIYIQVAGVPRSQFSTDEGRQNLANEVANHLIETELLIEMADDRGLSVTTNDVDAYLAQQQTAMGIGADAFEDELEANGILLEDFREFMHGNLTRIRLVQIDVLGSIQISDDDIDRAIAEDYPDGLADIYLTTSHILVTTSPTAESEIQALYQRLLAGERFEDLAAQNADASSSRGGRVGTFILGRLAADYERAALALEPGEVSEPVETQFGWHIIRLDERENREVDDAEALRDNVAFELQQREAERQESIYLERLRDDAFVRVQVTEWDL